MSKYSERSSPYQAIARPWAMIHERDSETVQRMIGHILKEEYSEIPEQNLPPRLQELLDKLDRAQNATRAKSR